MLVTTHKLTNTKVMVRIYNCFFSFATIMANKDVYISSKSDLLIDRTSFSTCISVTEIARNTLHSFEVQIT